MPSADLLERSLLSGVWSQKTDSDASESTLEAAKQVIDGAYRDFFTSPRVRDLLGVPSDQDTFKPLTTWFLFSQRAGDTLDAELVRLLTAIACLNAFLQANWTGPDLDVAPLDILSLPYHITEEDFHQKSVAELAYGGEPAYHLAQVPIFFRLAQLLLEPLFHHLPSAEWWRLRVWNVHEQILDDAAVVPTGSLPALDGLAEKYADDPDLVGRLWLERGLLEHYQKNDKAALEFFVRAARATDLQYELTGALGKRTKFQQTDLSQLVLLAESRPRADQDTNAKQAKNGISKSTTNLPETLALNDDTLLEKTEFTSSTPAGPNSRLSHLDPSAQPALHPLDQCILLSLCLNVRNTSPAHGLTNEQMSPYVARVLSHPENWSVHTMALLLRARLEAHRTRTVERATLQLQALIDQMPTADAPLPERLRYLHCLPLPSKWEMEHELARRFLSLGVLKSALAIFERREMWEEAVRCWQATDRRDKAVALVRDLLEGKKAAAETVLERRKTLSTARRTVLDAAREAKLWCLLGELEPEHTADHFRKAWAVSKGTSGRAMRSLGGYHFARDEFADAIVCLRKAVAINPLLSRSWFILGCACVRVEDWEGAREAFARCVALEEEDAESWNNLATVYLRMKRVSKKTVEGEHEEEKDEEDEPAPSKDELLDDSIPFENKMLAFRALQQGLKFRYDNWRMWMNYMVVAMDVGELAEAARALGRVVEERAAKLGAEAVDEDVLDRLVDAVTRAPADPDEAVEGSGAAANAVHNPNEGHGLLRRVDDLFERVLLPRVSSPRVFRARARLVTWQGNWKAALQAYLDAYRAGVAGKIDKGETDVERWREGVKEVEETVDVLRNFGPRVEGSKWRAQARSIVRIFMGRTKDFEEEKEWQDLVDLQEELKNEE